MAISTKIKNKLNALLAFANLRVEALTAERREQERIEKLRASGHFERPVFPVPSGFLHNGSQVVFDNLPQHRERFATFLDAGRNDVGYSFDNKFFSSPDAEVLYTLVRLFRPRRVIEIGSGNSTRITRQAIKDGNLPTRLVSVDPFPRREVAQICDETFRERVENGSVRERLHELESGDFLFIDSSHEVKTGNDVVYLLLNVLPALRPGVFVHVHDIALPYEYPADWVSEWHWNEQYLVQALLIFGDAFEIIWPGHYLQKTRQDFSEHFPFSSGRKAYNLWVRKIK